MLSMSITKLVITAVTTMALLSGPTDAAPFNITTSPSNQVRNATRSGNTRHRDILLSHNSTYTLHPMPSNGSSLTALAERDNWPIPIFNKDGSERQNTWTGLPRRNMDCNDGNGLKAWQPSWRVRDNTTCINVNGAAAMEIIDPSCCITTMFKLSRCDSTDGAWETFGDDGCFTTGYQGDDVSFGSVQIDCLNDKTRERGICV